MFNMQILFFGILLAFSISVKSYKLDGKVILPGDGSITETRILVDDGTYKGFIRSDGSFTVHNIPTGTYVLTVHNPLYYYEPVRVDISSKGSIRARKLNNLKPSAVSLTKYPIEMKPISLIKYFQIREKFSILDMLKSPMVLMMVLPMLLLFILPKMMNASDPETRREMENSMNMFNQNSSQMPDMSEFLSKYLGGSKKKTTAAKPIASPSRNSKATKRRKE